MLHTHRCGLTAVGQLESYGCGHVWSHETAANWTLKEHYCPKCGRGPFTFQLENNPVSMQSDELVEKIKDAQKRHGKPLPVVMLTAGGSGEITSAEVTYDMHTQRYELHLLEKP